MMLTAALEAKEGRDVGTVDIPKAFIQTEVEETDKDGNKIIMEIRGNMVDLLLAIDEEMYHPMIVYEKGQKTLYVQC